MHVPITTRFDPGPPRFFWKKRKYGPEFIEQMLLLAMAEGVKSSSLKTGVPYNTVKRYLTAYKRRTQTLAEALESMEHHPMMTAASPADRERIIGGPQRSLSMNVEAAREAYRIAHRTGEPLSRCIKGVALHRGLNGQGVLAMVRDGRIPAHWINGP